MDKIFINDNRSVHKFVLVVSFVCNFSAWEWGVGKGLSLTDSSFL